MLVTPPNQKDKSHDAPWTSVDRIRLEPLGSPTRIRTTLAAPDAMIVKTVLCSFHGRAAVAEPTA